MGLLKLKIIEILQKDVSGLKYADLIRKIPQGPVKTQAKVAQALKEMVAAGEVVKVRGYGKQTVMYRLGAQDAEDNASRETEAGPTEEASPQDFWAATQDRAQRAESSLAASTPRSVRSLCGGLEEV